MSSAFAHSTQPVAAWAEVVPGRPRLGADDLAALPDDGWQYERVRGVLMALTATPPGPILGCTPLPKWRNGRRDGLKHR